MAEHLGLEAADGRDLAQVLRAEHVARDGRHGAHAKPNVTGNVCELVRARILERLVVRHQRACGAQHRLERIEGNPTRRGQELVERDVPRLRDVLHRLGVVMLSQVSHEVTEDTQVEVCRRFEGCQRGHPMLWKPWFGVSRRPGRLTLDVGASVARVRPCGRKKLAGHIGHSADAVYLSSEIETVSSLRYVGETADSDFAVT